MAQEPGPDAAPKKRSKRTYALWAVALALLLVFGVGGAGALYWGFCSAPRTHESLVVRMDRRGPVVIFSTARAREDFSEALDELRKLHQGAQEEALDTSNLDAARRVLVESRARYAILLIKPDELDVNLAWKWLRLTTEIDEDPFVDTRTGFITGATPAEAAKFVRRIADAAAGRLKLPGAFVDNLGPNTMVARSSFTRTPMSFMIPVFGERLSVNSISHGSRGFTRERLGSMDGAGLVHFGGHGYPDRVVDCLSGRFARKLKLAPCVVFSGACYTGVSGRWFDMRGRLLEKKVKRDESFCLSMIAGNTVGYLAALHPDHGIPVYQELEFMAVTGATLGEVIKHTHDGVIIGAGGKLPLLPELKHGMARPETTPAQIMLSGTAARVLFGDPSLAVTEALTRPAFEVNSVQQKDGTLRVSARLQNAALKAEFTDTYSCDLAAVKNGFNDRALISCELPSDWKTVSKVTVIAAKRPDGMQLGHRLVGWAVERDDGKKTLRVQVDLPSTGYMQSEFRRKGSVVELLLNR
jgi:hypothetical protein